MNDLMCFCQVVEQNKFCFFEKVSKNAKDCFGVFLWISSGMWNFRFKVKIGRLKWDLKHYFIWTTKVCIFFNSLFFENDYELKLKAFLLVTI